MENVLTLLIFAIIPNTLTTPWKPLKTLATTEDNQNSNHIATL